MGDDKKRHVFSHTNLKNCLPSANTSVPVLFEVDLNYLHLFLLRKLTSHRS